MGKTLLATLLEDYDLTQRRLAIGLGINQGKLSMLINRKSKPTKEEAAKLSSYFGMTIEQILE